MRISHPVLALPILLLLLSGCSNSDDDGGNNPPDPPDPQRGDRSGIPLVASFSTSELLALAASNNLTELLLEEVLSPDCRIDVYHYEYQTVDPAGNLIRDSAALMLPNDTAENARASVPSCCTPTARTRTRVTTWRTSSPRRTAKDC